MAQVGVDLCTLPNIDGFCHLVVCIDYFTEAKPIKDKTAVTVAQFFIRNDVSAWLLFRANQGREFVNEISAEIHTKTGVKQRITSAYHPQSNGLVERQNITIKNCLVKVCNENPATWPGIIDGILFAHRVSRHSST